ncbi:MAG: YitT family protein [Phyllobacteriaceae bacterium]|nr:YitT family protein [Phyllobacteriaceae bacterium]
MGTLFVALGLTLYQQAQLLTGSTAGIALLVQYGFGTPFGITFWLINLPFYALAYWRFGAGFTLRTFIAVGLISALSRLTPEWIALTSIAPIYAAIAGGALQGMGLLILFRHRTGLGGFNILALYLQDNHGIRAGWFQLGMDGLIMAAALLVLPWPNVALSVLGAVVLNVTLGLNHKPGRYMAVS